MPLYELFCLARPALTKPQLADIISRAGKAVFAGGGVVTDIRSFGERPLAYEIRKPTGIYSEANMWKLCFMMEPTALKEVEHGLRVDDRVLRWMFTKHRALPVLPKPHRVGKYAEMGWVPTLRDPYSALLPETENEGTPREL